jgi:hypothetical protein
MVGVTTRTTTTGSTQHFNWVAGAGVAVALLLVWPIPTVVGGFVLAGAWMLDELEQRHLDAHRHHAANVRAARARLLLSLAAALCAATAAERWPRQVVAGALVFVSAAACLLILSGWFRPRPLWGTGARRPRSPALAVVPVTTRARRRRPRR